MSDVFPQQDFPLKSAESAPVPGERSKQYSSANRNTLGGFVSDLRWQDGGVALVKCLLGTEEYYFAEGTNRERLVVCGVRTRLFLLALQWMND